jgi:hypothetical protein
MRSISPFGAGVAGRGWFGPSCGGCRCGPARPCAGCGWSAPGGDVTEQGEGAQQSQDKAVPEAQPRGPMALDRGGQADPLEQRGLWDAPLGDPLSVQHTQVDRPGDADQLGVSVDGSNRATFKASTLNLVLPTSDDGLVPGDLWNDEGTVKIVLSE